MSVIGIERSSVLRDLSFAWPCPLHCGPSGLPFLLLGLAFGLLFVPAGLYLGLDLSSWAMSQKTVSVHVLGHWKNGHLRVDICIYMHIIIQIYTDIFTRFFFGNSNHLSARFLFFAPFCWCKGTMPLLPQGHWMQEG